MRKRRDWPLLVVVKVMGLPVAWSQSVMGVQLAPLVPAFT
jgi:hypothetical protein